MALQKYRLRVDAAHAGQRLDQALADLLPGPLGEPVSRGKARKLIMAGAVYLDRKRVRVASRLMKEGAAIEVMLDKARWDDSRGPSREPFTLTVAHVVYEDGDILVVNKPEGIPTQPTVDEARANLYASIKKYLQSTGASPDGYAGLHHRLDSDTSGLLLFTKTKRANPGVAKLFAAHAIRKTYLALSLRAPGAPARIEAEWAVRNFLGRLPGPSKPQRFGSVRSGGDTAETRFKSVEDLGGAVLVEASPLTGRTHQIRVHLSEMGLPIAGDRLYGGVRDGVGRLMLHAWRLEFAHPVTGAPMALVAEPPESFGAVVKTFQKG